MTASFPLPALYLAPASAIMWAVSGSALLLLALLGVLGAAVGGAPMITAAARVTLWGALAMTVTVGVGALFAVTP